MNYYKSFSEVDLNKLLKATKGLQKEIEAQIEAKKIETGYYWLTDAVVYVKDGYFYTCGSSGKYVLPKDVVLKPCK